ncbi:MAG TPA: hypothetical protein PKM48_14950 [Parvularculaceae bacterium]|nr:hypothetical protein [Parvularculaceae bacterium]HNS86386.1 hypothetical protein [Parvularculaceae bacterium]
MKKAIVAAVWLIVLALWAGIVAFKMTFEPDIKQWTVAVTAGALAMEVAFWITAAVLGITLFQSRKAAFNFLTRPFRKKRSESGHD